MSQVVARKQGIVARIDAVAIQCPDCGSFCVNESGSTMIEDGDNIVTCTSCQSNYTVPPLAFKVPLKKTSIKSAVRSYVRKQWKLHCFIGSTDIDWRGLTQEVISQVPHTGVGTQQMASWVQEFGRQFSQQEEQKQMAKETDDWWKQYQNRTYGEVK